MSSQPPFCFVSIVFTTAFPSVSTASHYNFYIPMTYGIEHPLVCLMDTAIVDTSIKIICLL